MIRPDLQGRRNPATGVLPSLFDAVQTDHFQAGAIDEERNTIQIAHADEVSAVFDERDKLLAAQPRRACDRVISRTIFDAPTTLPAHL